MKVLNANICLSDHDLIFIPFSSEGYMQRDFEEFLRQHQLTPFVPTNAELGSVHYLKVNQNKGIKHVILCCTNLDVCSSYTYIWNIIIKASELKEFVSVKNIGLPLLGAGGGGLDPVKTATVLAATIAKHWKKDKQVTYYHQDEKDLEALAILELDNTNKDSLKLVFDYSISDLMNAEWVRELKSLNEFYFQLAQDKLNEFIAYQADTGVFFQELYDAFTNSKANYQEYLRSYPPESKYYKFLELCGQVVAYIDRNAYNKRVWNKYPDNRTVARSGVNQNNWVSNLIFFKAQNENFSTFTPNIINAVNFLRFPEEQLCMLSEQHRKNVCEKVFRKTYVKEKFPGIVFEHFNAFGKACKNIKNNSVLFIRLLYTPEIKILWYEVSRRKKSDNSESLVETQNPQTAEELRMTNLNALIHSDIYARADLLNYEPMLPLLHPF